MDNFITNVGSTFSNYLTFLADNISTTDISTSNHFDISTTEVNNQFNCLKDKSFFPYPVFKSSPLHDNSKQNHHTLNFKNSLSLHKVYHKFHTIYMNSKHADEIETKNNKAFPYGTVWAEVCARAQSRLGRLIHQIILLNFGIPTRLNLNIYKYIYNTSTLPSINCRSVLFHNNIKSSFIYILINNIIH